MFNVKKCPVCEKCQCWCSWMLAQKVPNLRYVLAYQRRVGVEVGMGMRDVLQDFPHSQIKCSGEYARIFLVKPATPKCIPGFWFRVGL